MRGYFLCVILFNHLQYYPNFLTPVTGQGILYASTAEGFFAVSGIVLGIVRGRKLLDKPLSVAAKLLWKRAAQLYIASIALTLIFTFIGQFFLQNPGLKYGIYTDWSDPLGFVWQTITMSYSYGWADFLRYYACFLAFAPFALWLIRKGHWLVVVLLSVIAWGLYPLFFFNTTTMQPVSWQLIFFSSFIIGYYWQDIIAFWRRLAPLARKTIVQTWFLVFAITLVMSFMLVLGSTLENETGAQLLELHHQIEQYFNKDEMPLARILLGTIWFWGIFMLFRRFEGSINKRLGWLLYEFGSHSLYVYIISAFVIFGMNLLIAPPGIDSRLGNLLLSLFALGLVWIALRTRFLAKIIPR